MIPICYTALPSWYARLRKRRQDGMRMDNWYVRMSEAGMSYRRRIGTRAIRSRCVYAHRDDI